MFYITMVSEALLYLCFALLIGTYILRVVPQDLKPRVDVPVNLLLASAAGIALFSFIPLLNSILFLADTNGMLSAVEVVLLTFHTGQTWMVMFFISIFLALYIAFSEGRGHGGYSWGGLALVFLLASTMSWASHASSISDSWGFTIHALHFLAVIIWVGILAVVSFFSKNYTNWLPFLGWFQNIALQCLALILLSGILLVSIVGSWSGYSDSWSSGYGQSLLIKHLLIIPLLGYACINGIWMKKRLRKNYKFDPRPWTKMEFLIILLIFAATGAMNQQSPPANLANIIEREGASPLFSFFAGSPSVPFAGVALSINGVSIIFAMLSIVFLFISMGAFHKKLPPLFSFGMALLVAICAYLALMQSVTVL